MDYSASTLKNQTYDFGKSTGVQYRRSQGCFTADFTSGDALGLGTPMGGGATVVGRCASAGSCCDSIVWLEAGCFDGRIGAMTEGDGGLVVVFDASRGKTQARRAMIHAKILATAAMRFQRGFVASACLSVFRRCCAYSQLLPFTCSVEIRASSTFAVLAASILWRSSFIYRKGN